MRPLSKLVLSFFNIFKLDIAVQQSAALFITKNLSAPLHIMSQRQGTFRKKRIKINAME